MRDQDLLDIWDDAGAGDAAHRALHLTAGFGIAPSVADAAALAVGARDSGLLEAHRDLFAKTFSLVSHCPACDEPAEFAVRIDDLLAQVGASDWPIEIPFRGGLLICRRPTHTDLATAWSQTQSLSQARRRLCALCVVHRSGSGDTIDIDDDAMDTASMALGVADPLGDIAFTSTCPTCATVWDAAFDPVHALWRALDGWSRSVLSDVQRLAATYGWPEDTILAMSAHRRRFYLDATP